MVQLLGPQHAAGHHNHERVKDRDQQQSQDHAQRDQPARLLDLAGDAGDLQQAPVRDEHEAGRGENRPQPIRGKRLEVPHVDGGQPPGNKEQHQSQQRDNEHHLEARRLLHSDEIDHDKREPQTHPDDVLVHRHERCQQDRRSNEGKGAFERQAEPAQDPRRRAHRRTHRAGDVEIVGARLGHGGRQFDDAEQAAHGEQAGQEIRQHDGRPGPRVCQPRQDEQTGADHRAGGDGKDVNQTQFFRQFHPKLTHAESIPAARQ